MKSSLLLSTVALLAIPSPGRANDTSAEVATSSNEIVITARKKDEKLQDIPLSVSVFGDKELSERGMRDMSQVSQFTPGLSFERTNRYGIQGGVSRPVIRGMSNINGEPNAAIFVDGIPYTDSIMSFPLDLVERVEVIKGPQAALYGRSTFAGAINLITKRGGNTPEYRASATVAGYGEREVNLLARGPIVDDVLFYSVHGRRYETDGQYRNSLDGKKVGQEASWNFNGSLEFRPTSNFTMNLSGGYTHDDDGHPAMALQDRFHNNCYLNAPRQYFCGAVTPPDEATLDLDGLHGLEGLVRKSYRLSGSIVWELGGFKITSNTGVFATKTQFGYDSTYMAATALGRYTVPGAPGYNRASNDGVRTGGVLRNELGERDEFSTELRVETPQLGIFTPMVGASYYKRRRDLVEDHFDNPAPLVDFGTDRIDNWAIFGSVGATLAPGLNASFEIRYAEDTIGNYKTTGNKLIEQTFKSWTPRLTVDYRISPRSMVYVTIARGNKPGVINNDPRFPEEVRFAREESSNNVEFGTKSEFFNRRLTVNAAVYYVDWKKQQLTSAYTFTDGTSRSYIVNAGVTEVKGAEIEVQGIVNDLLTVGGSFSINDARFKAFDDSEAGEIFGNTSVAGKRTPNSSKYQSTLFARLLYSVTDDLKLLLRADGAFNSKRYAQVYNLAHTGDQHLLNLRAGIQNDRWSLQFFVDNVTKDRTPSSVSRWVDQLNLNVPQYVNANPLQNNALLPNGTLSTTSERGFHVALPAKRKFGISGSINF